MEGKGEALACSPGVAADGGGARGAPVSLLVSFMEAVHVQDMNLALQLSDQILRLEPHNSTVQQFQPVLLGIRQQQQQKLDEESQSMGGGAAGSGSDEEDESDLGGDGGSDGRSASGDSHDDAGDGGIDDDPGDDAAGGGGCEVDGLVVVGTSISRK